MDEISEVSRYGWIANGVVYSTMGLIGLTVGIRDWSSTQEASQKGALRTLVDQPLGSIIVLVLGLGLGLYSVWKFADSLKADSTGLLSRARRIGNLGLSAVYGFLAIGAIQMTVFGSGGGGSDAFSPSRLAREVMMVGFGRWVVAAVGLCVIALGGYHIWKAWRFRFLNDLESEPDEPVGTAARVFGSYGMIARAAILATSGWLAIEAAVDFDPSEAGGFDKALRELAQQPAGRIGLIVVALGFVAAGAYDAMTYRHQKLG